MSDSRITYSDDFQFAQMLLSGDADAWDRFYKEFHKKLELYIKRKYPDVFSEIAIEEICDGVKRRLIDNEYKALKDYRGECDFSTYVTKATDWETKDWLRKHSDELFNEPIDPEKEYKNRESEYSFSPDEKEEIPKSIKPLSDDLRWAFLLRHYDYFGFPFDEMRLLAKKNSITIGSITKKIIKFLEPEGEDILRVQRQKQRVFQLRLQKLCFEINKLTVKEQQLLADEEYTQGIRNTEKLDIVKNRRSRLEAKREALLKNKTRLIITTPYEVIAEILGEENVSTIRSRVFLAKKQLAQILKKNE